MIAERLKQYFEFKDISYYQVEKTIEVSTGCISGAVRHKRNIGSNILQKILLVYSDLSSEWLFRGIGEMIIDEESTSNDPALKFQSLSDNWLIDKMLTFFNVRSKHELISFFERIHGVAADESEAGDNLSPFEQKVLEVIQKRYGSTLANADELYAMYLQKLMREGEEMLNKKTEDKGTENQL